MSDIDLKEMAEMAETSYPEFKEFLDVWSVNCGASREVYRVHLFDLVRKITNRLIMPDDVDFREALSLLEYSQMFSGQSLKDAIEKQADKKHRTPPL